MSLVSFRSEFSWGDSYWEWFQ